MKAQLQRWLAVLDCLSVMQNEIRWCRWNRFLHNEVQLSINPRCCVGDLSWHTTLFLSSRGSKEAICIAVVGILIVRLLQSQSEGVSRRGSSHSWINHSDGWVYAPALGYCLYDLLLEDLRVTMNIVLKALYVWMLIPRVHGGYSTLHLPKINYHCGFLDFKIPPDTGTQASWWFQQHVTIPGRYRL